MKRAHCLYLTAFALLPALAGAASAQVAPPDTAEAAVRQVVEGFGRALAAGDSTGALALLHPDVIIFEAGHAETREEYRSGHLRSDIAFASAVTRKVTTDDVMVSGNVALYTSVNTASGTFRNRQINNEGTETMVLVRTPQGWKIRHIHWS